MVLIDDVIIAVSAAVATASLIVLAMFLSRYRALVKDATKSGELAKNIWDAMNSRLMTQDARIIDLMARFEVNSARSSRSPSAQASAPAPKAQKTQVSRVETQQSQPISQEVPQRQQSESATKDTGATILEALAQGPKTSNQIRDAIGLTREHTGRLMKLLYTRGLVVRSDQNKPYVYEITDSGRRYLENSRF